ncbi:urease accessory protein UreD [Aphanothece sacrum]|uniref:Urease accessory protein UreD n=1 Tax=Aphanothece sacrum FPU1 TaxID=1920663 RepID=A0A401IK14_APHSA|nr:urease accessory protein UreD [Aphanothece sacrum]GBF81556.1 urease accessory protein UreH [Aphanothece sacrum FPU1]GBF86987.1 urease accessory protein UreH [Aphanothece sacrum FPU3]
MKNLNYQKNLELILIKEQNKTIITHQYTAQPLGISRAFRPDITNPSRTHLYLTSTSPGLLANDSLNIELKLKSNTQLFLTDQSATKVHPMPYLDTKATINYEVQIEENATLEFCPEPIILFQESTLEQSIKINCHPTANLFWSEIIVPGRLARGEFYDFNYYMNRLQINSLSGELLLIDATILEGKNNLFKHSNIFTSAPILGNIIMILPQANLSLLREHLEKIDKFNCPGVRIATSILPQNKGLVIRAIAQGTYGFKKYLSYALTCFRQFLL